VNGGEGDLSSEEKPLVQRRLIERPKKPLPEVVAEKEILIKPEHAVVKVRDSDEAIWHIDSEDDRKATFFSLKTNPLGSKYQTWIHGRVPVAPKKRESGPGGWEAASSIPSVTLKRGELLDIDFYLPFPEFLRAVERYIKELRSPEVKAKWRHLMLSLITSVKLSKEEVERWTREAALRKARGSRAKATLAAASNRRKARKRGRHG